MSGLRGGAGWDRRARTRRDLVAAVDDGHVVSVALHGRFLLSLPLLELSAQHNAIYPTKKPRPYLPCAAPPRDRSLVHQPAPPPSKVPSNRREATRSRARGRRIQGWCGRGEWAPLRSSPSGRSTCVETPRKQPLSQSPLLTSRVRPSPPLTSRVSWGRHGGVAHPIRAYEPAGCAASAPRATPYAASAAHTTP